MTTVSLSTVKPDPESILLQLQLALQSKATWVDLQTSGVGETLMELMAAVSGFNQFGIESAAREGFLSTAVRDSSIYAITRMLGVRIHRKYPAGVNCNLLRPDTTLSYVIPKLTPFSVDGNDFFNRNPIMYAQGADTASERVYYGTILSIVSTRSLKFDTDLFSVSALSDGDEFRVLVNAGSGAGQLKSVTYVADTATFDLVATEADWSALGASSHVSVLTPYIRLYQGTIQTESFLSDGTSFKELYLSEANFNISDTDVQVYVVSASGATVEWSAISDGMWIAGSTDSVYYDSTSGAGETILAFGDGEHGVVPVLASTINVKYAITKGSSANSGLTGLAVTCPSDSTLKGTTIGVISGGADEKPASYYQYMAPMIFKAKNRAVTKDDYVAIALDYPGIISASVMAQKDIAPDDLRWMNVVQMCLLPLDTGVDALTAAEWNDFLAYFENKKHEAIHIKTKDPVRQLATVDITLALKGSATPSSVLPLAEAALNNLFARQADTLGRRIALNDVNRAAAVTGVDYVDVNICKLATDTDLATDLIPVDRTHFIALVSLTINTRYSERAVYYGGTSI